MMDNHLVRIRNSEIHTEPGKPYHHVHWSAIRGQALRIMADEQMKAINEERRGYVEISFEAMTDGIASVALFNLHMTYINARFDKRLLEIYGTSPLFEKIERGVAAPQYSLDASITYDDETGLPVAYDVKARRIDAAAH